MLFNSVEFALFLPIVFFLYWFVVNKNLKGQNALILLASYLFYGWWDWRFLSLILISSLVDYVIGLQIWKTKGENKRRWLLYLSLSANIGLLGFFKYFDFFIDSFVIASQSIGISANVNSLNIILPVGISFYTFQTLSYTIDIYKGKLKPTQNLLAFCAFVSFFPQLVAGPIERAKNLLPQFEINRKFDLKTSVDGLRQILWGLFKKIVIADTCASQADYIFANYSTLNGSLLILGAIYFAFQIYGDFSGYSDIAIGTAKLFGFTLMRNFALPYFSRDIAEFWRRWHISLSTWFRDYVYIPIGGSHGTKFIHIRNVIITFTISGFWHGANWTFIFWGFLNGLYYIPLLLMKKQKDHTDMVASSSFLPSIREASQMLATFSLILIAWIFFRSASLSDAFNYISIVFSASIFSIPDRTGTLLFVLVLILIEWIQRRKTNIFQIDDLHVTVRWALYLSVSLLILLLFKKEQAFIYFTF